MTLEIISFLFMLWMFKFGCKGKQIPSTSHHFSHLFINTEASVRQLNGKDYFYMLKSIGMTVKKVVLKSARILAFVGEMV